jgi:serine/threonine protein kinase
LTSSTAATSLQDGDSDMLQEGDAVDHGYFVRFGKEYKVDGCAEALEQYESGLRYPIRIGDVLMGTYCIEHKLGHGDSSTVWLARDTKKERDVALKIMNLGEAGDHEYSMQKKIIKAVKDTSNLVTYLTAFSLRGHRILVFPVRGPSFSSVMLNQISMVNLMSAARQLLKALECLHNANIVHNSELTQTCFSLISVHTKYSTDLNRDNVMWGITPLDNLNTKTKYRYLGRPKKIALPSRQGELVRPVEVPKQLLTDAVYLGGFGMATEVGIDVRHKMLPWNIRYYAPERFHNVNASFASDMWSYMCLFTDLYLGFIPWSSYTEVKLIPEMIRTLGPLPKQWKGHFNGHGICGGWLYDQCRRADPRATFESIIKEKRPEVGPVERNHIVSIMSKGFCYLPDDRPTATQLLQDPSFEAIMKIYCR